MKLLNEIVRILTVWFLTWAIVAAVIMGLAGLYGCANTKAQSWDQENLKSHDNTCKTMVYHNDPRTGILVQCP